MSPSAHMDPKVTSIGSKKVKKPPAMFPVHAFIKCVLYEDWKHLEKCFMQQ